MILVTGATGNVGRHLVHQLLDAGARVRAITRNPERSTLPGEVELFAGDLTRPDTLREAFHGARGVYLFPVFAAPHAPLKAARDGGVGHVVLLSSQSVTHAPGDPHLACEEAVTGSGLPWTLVRPSALMINDLPWAAQIRATGAVRGIYGHTPATPIDERDIAAVIAHSLLDPQPGTVHTLTGPQSLTPVQRVRIIAEQTGRRLRFEELPREHVRQQMLAHLPASVADDLLDQRAAAQGTTAQVLPTVEEVTGRPAHTYAQWLTHHRADFPPHTAP